MKNIPLGITIILAIVSGFVSIKSDYLLDNKYYIGAILLLLSIVFYFIKKDIYYYLFGILLLLATIGVGDLYYEQIRVGVGPVSINPVFFVLLIIYFWSNNEFSNSLFPKNIQSVSANEINEEMVNTFQKQYGSKNREELMKIASSESGFVREAKLAAERLLDENFPNS